MKTLRAWWPIAALTATVAMAGCGSASETTAPAAGAPLPVDTEPVAETDLIDRFEVGGTVRASETAIVTSRIVAPVIEVLVSPGDRVRRGQTLVRLDNRAPAAEQHRAQALATAAERQQQAAETEAAAADAARMLAAATRTRIVRLHEQKSATDQELDEANAAWRAAESRAEGAAAQVEAARAALASARAAADGATVTAGFAALTAPFGGLVTEKLIEPGNMASPGVPLVRLEAEGGYRVDVQVDESRAGLVDVGDTVEVLVDAGPGGDVARVSGRVSEKSGAVDSRSRAVLVKVALTDAGDVTAGTFARVRFEAGRRRALTVPASALVERGQVSSVFVVDGDRARLRLVQPGRSGDDRVEIVAGLSVGEPVVVAPPATLVDGHPVSVRGTR